MPIRAFFDGKLGGRTRTHHRPLRLHVLCASRPKLASCVESLTRVRVFPVCPLRSLLKRDPPPPRHIVGRPRSAAVRKILNPYFYTMRDSGRGRCLPAAAGLAFSWRARCRGVGWGQRAHGATRRNPCACYVIINDMAPVGRPRSGAKARTKRPCDRALYTTCQT